MGSKKQNLKNPREPFCRPCFSMYYPFFVCIWLKNSIFGEFSNIYLQSDQNRVKWRHKIRPIAKNVRPILIFFARDDAKLMHGEVCQVSCWYSNKWSYSGKTEGGGGRIWPPPGGGGLKSMGKWDTFICILSYNLTIYISSKNPTDSYMKLAGLSKYVKIRFFIYKFTKILTI